MKLYIHDKCMEQLFELPKVISKKVLEFQKKFRENSKSEAINLESINTFKDPNLRTARIDQKYRAIIRVPDSGDNFYLLWVDNHDEAMDWAINKIFQWNENTQTAQIFTAPEVAKESVSQKELNEIALFIKYSDAELISIGVPNTLIGLIRTINNLSDLDKAEKYLPVDAFENLFYLAEGININSLIEEINNGKSASKNIDDQINSNNNKRNFVEIDDELIEEIINGDLSKWQIFLHPTQRNLVESNFKGSVKVTGGAGTGKTVVALHRLKHLSDLPTSFDDRKSVFTTFTNSLTTNLKILANKLNIDNGKTQITNIDSLVKDLAIQNGIIDATTKILDMYNSKNSIEIWEEILEKTLTEFDTKFLTDEYQKVILYNNVADLETYFQTSRIGRGKPITRKQKMDAWELFQEYVLYKINNNFVDRAELFNKMKTFNDGLKLKPFKYVIADEIQDLSNVELRFLRSLVEEKENDLFLVGDPFQKIYSRKANFNASGISIRGNRSKQLRINYRTSEEIKRLALSIVKDINYDDFDGEQEKLNGYLSLFHGTKPTYEIFKTKLEENQKIIDLLIEFKEKGLKYNEMAIGCRTKDSLKEIKSTLHKLKIPYNDITVGSNDFEGIILSTLHGLKGLEFKAVIIADTNNRTCPLLYYGFDQLEDQEKQDYINSEKSLIYVAMTRAINNLVITGTGVKSTIVNI